jgi:hypothetical protein
MPTKHEYQEFIQRELNKITHAQYTSPEDNRIALAYQLGYLQGFLVKLMTERREIAGEFRDQVKNTLKHLDK